MMTERLYGFYFDSRDKDGETKQHLCDLTDYFDKTFTVADVNDYIVAFLSQTDSAYVDCDGIIHEIYEGVDQRFAYVFKLDDRVDPIKYINDMFDTNICVVEK